MSRTTRIAAFFTLLSVAAAPAMAATFCVSTGAQLTSAVTTAASNGVDDEIRVVIGTLASAAANSQPRWSYRPTLADENTLLTLSGGWSNGNNCLSQSPDPALTALDGEFKGSVLTFVPALGSTPFSGGVAIRNLTLTRGRSFDQGVAGGFNASPLTMTASAFLHVDNILVVAGNSTVATAPAVNISSTGGTTRLRNSIVHSNTSSGSGSIGGVAVNGSTGAIAYVNNNTIYGNTGTLSAGAGLLLSGTVNLANNAVAENQSTAGGTLYQVYSHVGGGLLMRNNHFGSAFFTQTPTGNFSMTTGDPQWTAVGSLRIPAAESQLRDSGHNSALGGIGSTDFTGANRTINSVVDRGAVEAAIVNLGPSVTPNTPASGSTTTLSEGPISTQTSGSITFTKSGGSGTGVTTLTCSVGQGQATLTNASQILTKDNAVLPVGVSKILTAAQQTTVINCGVARQNGGSSNYGYTFITPAGTQDPVGPTISAVDPFDGSTTALPAGVLGSTIEQVLTFTASGGTGAGTTELSCGPNAFSDIEFVANASQTVVVGGAVQPVVVRFTRKTGTQSPGVVCTVTPQKVAPSFLQFFFTLPAATIGPEITAKMPAAGSTTATDGNAVGVAIDTPVTFDVTGGAGGGSSSLSCSVVQGSATIAANGLQQGIQAGNTVQPVMVRFVLGHLPQSANVECAVQRENAPSSLLTYSFNAPAGANASIGPTVTAAQPASGSTTALQGGAVGSSVETAIGFSVSGGVGGGTTALACVATSGSLELFQAVQNSIPVGGQASPVIVRFTLATVAQAGTVECTATPQNGTPTLMTYGFTAPAGNLGPSVLALHPAAGSTTMVGGGALGANVDASISFQSSGGSGSGTTSLTCSVFSGSALLVANATQVDIAVGGSVLPVGVRFTLTAAPQNAVVQCNVAPQHGTPAILSYTFTAPAANSLVGPNITGIQPLPGSTTALGGGALGAAVDASIAFSVTGGAGEATTSLSCLVTSGTASLVENAEQPAIAVGGQALPVSVRFILAGMPQNGGVTCTATPQNGSPSQMSYSFTAPAGADQGPAVFSNGFE
jgi:hypothetical protein